MEREAVTVPSIDKWGWLHPDPSSMESSSALEKGYRQLSETRLLGVMMKIIGIKDSLQLRFRSFLRQTELLPSSHLHQISAAQTSGTLDGPRKASLRWPSGRHL